MIRSALFFLIFAMLSSAAFGQDFGLTFEPAASSTDQKLPYFQVVQGSRGVPAALRITACKSEAMTASSKTDLADGINLFIDAVDASGNVVNDKVANLDVALQLQESGSSANSAFFADGASAASVKISGIAGASAQLYDLESEDVTIVAKASSLQDSSGLKVHFIASGALSGRILLPSGAMVYGLGVYAQNQQDPLFIRGKQISLLQALPGAPVPYAITGLKVGNYTVSIQALQDSDPASVYVRAVCYSNSTLKGQVTVGPYNHLGRLYHGNNPGGGRDRTGHITRILRLDRNRSNTDGLAHGFPNMRGIV